MFDFLKKKTEPETAISHRSVIWRCDYCEFEFIAAEKPYIELVDYRTGEAFITVGRGDEFGDYDTTNFEEAIESALDVLHLHNVPITYNGTSDEELGYEYGEYGSHPEWLSGGTVSPKR